MHFFTTILHIVLCITLILIILLQPGKGAGSVFGGGGGGGGNQMYGPRGQGHFLGKATTVIAATFMFTSITLAFYSRPSEEASTETLKAIREIEQAGTEVVVETDSEKIRQEQLQTAQEDIRDVAAQESQSSSTSESQGSSDEGGSTTGGEGDDESVDE
jgi:preprotein translocase subunit SecG